MFAYHARRLMPYLIRITHFPSYAWTARAYRRKERGVELKKRMIRPHIQRISIINKTCSTKTALYDTIIPLHASCALYYKMFHFLAQRNLGKGVRCAPPLHPPAVAHYRHRAFMHQRTCGRSITIWRNLQAAPKTPMTSHVPIECECCRAFNQ